MDLSDVGDARSLTLFYLDDAHVLFEERHQELGQAGDEFLKIFV